MNNMVKPKFKRFRDLEESDINVDLHMHTDYTDGEASIETILQAAYRTRLKSVAFTEHVRQDTEWYPDFVIDVSKNAKQYTQLNVFVGCEAKALDIDGSLDASDDILTLCEIVLGSVHRFPNGKGGYLNFSSLSEKEVAKIEFDLAYGLLKSTKIDVLAHPGGMYFRCYDKNFPELLMRKLMQESLARNIAIEINSAYLKNLTAFLSLCYDVNPIVSIGSDMHKVINLGHCRDQLLLHGVGT